MRVVQVVIADPGERQIGKRHIHFRQLVEGHRIGCGIDRTFAGEDDTFRGACRARGIENDRGIGALAGFNLLVEPCGHRGICEGFAAVRDDILHRSQFAVIVITQPPLFVVDHHLELRDAIHHRLNLVDLLLVFDGGKTRVGVRKHEGKFVGHRVGVDGHRNCAQHLRGHHRPIKSRPVAADDGNGLPALDAKIVQADGIGTHDVEHFVPRPGLPDAEILVPHGRARPIKLGVPDQQLGKRVRASGGIRRHSPVLPCGHARPSVAKTPRRLFLTILLSRYENTTRRRSSIR